MDPRQLPRPAVIGGLLVGVVAISTSAILARVAMGDDPGVATAPQGAAPALAVAFWRTALGALALAPWSWLSARRRGVRLDRRVHRTLAVSGLALGLHFALFQGSLALTTVASSVTLVTMSPLFVALGSRWFLREPADRRTWIGLVATMVGAATIGLGDAGAIELGPRALTGDAMAFGGALAITVYLLLGRAARREVPAVTYSALVFGWAALALLPVCLLAGVALTGYELTAWLAIAGVVLGPQLLGHFVFNTLLSTIPATVVSIAVLTEPVGAGLLAWWLLDELPAGAFYLGAPLVLVGVAVATVRGRRVPSPPPSPPPTAMPDRHDPPR